MSPFYTRFYSSKNEKYSLLLVEAKSEKRVMSPFYSPFTL